MDLTVIRAGRIGYNDALALQLELLGKRVRGETGDVIILLEHNPVITLGKRGVASDILVSRDVLQKNGIEVVETNRGGETTYHGPGQLVGYLIFDLRGHGGDIRRFVRNLEEVFIRLLEKEYGVEAGRDPVHTGVWVKDEKITAIGIALKQHVTMHGFAFNVTTDLDRFRLIIPCGIRDKGVTSLEKVLRAKNAGGTGAPDMDTVMTQVARHSKDVYGFA